MWYDDGQTVTLVRRVSVSVNSQYFNDDFVDVDTYVENVPVWQPSADDSQDPEDPDTLADQIAVLLPVGTDVSSVDQIVVAGQPYEIVGPPETFRVPLSEGLLVNLRRVM